MTTDTRPKLGSVTVETSQGAVKMAGIVKGAGMIAPNMATMLSVIVSDAKLSLPQAQESLSCATEQSYNRIVIDGDTSTNDMVFLLCNGAGVEVSSEADIAAFQAGLNALTRYLAQEVVRDGEGVTKFVTLEVVNAETEAAAHRIGQTIGASMLTKTALYGSDANWGRIVAAAGRAEVPFDPDRSSLWVAAGEEATARGLLIFEDGTPTDYLEAGRGCDYGGRVDHFHAGLRHGRGQCHDMDMRPEPRLCHDKWRLSLLASRRNHARCAGIGRRAHIPRARVRRAWHRDGRDRLQYFHDRLSGDLD